MSLAKLLGDIQPVGDKVELALNTLDDADRAALVDALHDPLTSAPAIAAALRKTGYDVAGHQVNHYRRKMREGKVQV